MDDVRPVGKSGHRRRAAGVIGRVMLALIAMGIIPGATAWAHKLVVFATVQGRTIQGQAYYQDGTPAKNAAVSILGPDGGQLGTTATDGEGKFTYQPRSRCRHTLVADVGFGHRAEHTVAAEELPADLAAPAAGDVTDAGSDSPAPALGPVTTAGNVAPSDLAAEIRALNQQIGALRQDLEKWKTKLRVQDVLGGVGYTLGILGLWSFFLAGRRREKALQSPS